MSNIGSKVLKKCALSIVLLALAVAVPATAADLPPWILDTFDAGAGFVPGALNGQSGWVRGQKSAQIVAYGGSGSVSDPGRGQVVLLNPNPGSGATINLTKTVPVQSARFHVVELDVMVTGAVDASVGKLEVQTSPNLGWDKKFQIYFGTSMRVNYGPTGAAVTVVPATQMGRWYHLRCQADLSTGLLDVYVDDALAASAVPMHPGSIRSVSVSGWEFVPGRVYLDNLVGFQQLARVATPVRGTVTGSVPVTIDTTAATTSVDVYLDWVFLGTLSGAPFSFTLPTTFNPVPVTAPFGFGYWRTQWKGQDAWSEPSQPPQSYTNIFYADSRIDFESFSGDPNWRSVQTAKMLQAAQAGRAIYLNLGVPYTCTLSSGSTVTWCSEVEDVLDMAQSVWPFVVAIDLADEPRWSAAQTNQVVANLEAGLQARGLMGATRPVPFGVVYPHGAFPSTATLSATNIDLVGLEAYLNAPGGIPYEFSPLPERNVARLYSIIQTERDLAAAAGKVVILIGQAYSRNFGWPRIELVADLQIPTYLWAISDPWVGAMTMFSYLRASGTKDYGDGLKTSHRLIGERALALPASPTTGNGPRSLIIRANDAAGNSTWDVVRLRVAN